MTMTPLPKSFQSKIPNYTRRLLEKLEWERLKFLSHPCPFRAFKKVVLINLVLFNLNFYFRTSLSILK